MLHLERRGGKREGGKNASEQRKKEESLLLPRPPFLFILFPAEANGKCQYLEANGVSGYIWVANTILFQKKKQKEKTNPRERADELLAVGFGQVFDMALLGI